MIEHHVRRARPAALTLLGAVLALLAAGIPASSPAGAEAGEGRPGTARSDATALAAGRTHTCAIAPDSSVRCWGENLAQLAQGNTNTIGDQPGESTVRVDLGSGRTARALASGGRNTCAILDTGQLRCWGANGNGELAQGNTTAVGDDPGETTVPVDLGPGRTATAVAVGDAHACAILDTGQLRCWGYNSYGQLGQGSTTSVGDGNGHPNTVAVDLGAGRTAVAIAAGDDNTCAILDTGRLRCWGYGADGELAHGDGNTVGDDELPTSITPIDLGAGRTAVAVTIGGSHVCAILDTGQLRCWGYNFTGQLGQGNQDPIGDSSGETTVPVNLGPGRTAVAVSAGTRGTCAVLDTGALRCWGRNDHGQLGQGNGTDIGDTAGETTVPVDLGGRTALAVVLGEDHTCVRLNGGSVRCWGGSQSGQSGRGTTETYGLLPGQVPAALADLVLVPPTAGPPPAPPAPPAPPVPPVRTSGAVVSGKKVVITTLVGVKKAAAGCPSKATVTVRTKGAKGPVKAVRKVRTKAVTVGGATTGCQVTGTVKLPAAPKGGAPVKVKVTGPNLKASSLTAARG